MPFKANIIACRQVPSADPSIYVVAYDLLPFCKTRRPLPFGGVVECGMLKHQNYFELPCDWLSDDAVPQFVRLRKVKYEPLGSDKFLINRADPPLLSRCVNLADAVHGPGKRGRGCAAGGDEVDWDRVLPTNRHTPSSSGKPKKPSPIADEAADCMPGIIEDVVTACIPEELQDLVGDSDDEADSASSCHSDDDEAERPSEPPTDPNQPQLGPLSFENILKS